MKWKKVDLNHSLENDALNSKPYDISTKDAANPDVPRRIPCNIRMITEHHMLVNFILVVFTDEPGKMAQWAKQ